MFALDRLTGRFSQMHWKIPKGVVTMLVVVALVAAMVGIVALMSLGVTIENKRLIAAAFGLVVLPGIVYAAIVRPLVFPFALYAMLVPFDNLLNSPGYGTVTKLLAICSAAAMAFWLLRNKRAVRPPAVMLAWALFALWAGMTIFWAIDPDVAVTRVLTYTELVALLGILSVMPADRTDLKVVLSATVLGSLVAAAYGVYLFHGGRYELYTQDGSTTMQRLIIKGNNTQIDPNHFANAMLLPIAIAAIATLRQGLSLLKIVLAVALLTLLAGVYVSGSREAFVGVCVVFGYLLLSRYRGQIIAVGVLLLAFSFTLPVTPWARFNEAAQTGGAGRLQIWGVAFDALKHYWLGGVGVGNFPNAYDRSFMNVYQSSTAAIVHWHFVSHNTPLGIAVELGVVGLFALLAGWYGQWRTLSRVSKTNPFYDLRLALEAAILALFTASMFIDMMPYKYAWLAFSLVVITRSVALASKQAVESVAARRSARAPFVVAPVRLAPQSGALARRLPDRA